MIRYEGPKGGPGMPEMLTPTSAIMGAGLGKECALITDGRFSGGSHGFVIGHVTPEAQAGGTIALVKVRGMEETGNRSRGPGVMRRGCDIEDQAICGCLSAALAYKGSGERFARNLLLFVLSGLVPMMCWCTRVAPALVHCNFVIVPYPRTLVIPLITER